MHSRHPTQPTPQQQRAVYQTCYRITRCRDLAWDAFQETFLVYELKKDCLDLARDIVPWLKETARRCSLALSRGRAVTVPWSERQAATPSHIDCPLTRSEDQRLLRRAFAQLGPQDRRLLRMRFQEGLSHRQLARRLRCPPGSVHHRLQRVLEILRRELELAGSAD